MDAVIYSSRISLSLYVYRSFYSIKSTLLLYRSGFGKVLQAKIHFDNKSLADIYILSYTISSSQIWVLEVATSKDPFRQVVPGLA